MCFIIESFFLWTAVLEEDLCDGSVAFSLWKELLLILYSENPRFSLGIVLV